MVCLDSVARTQSALRLNLLYPDAHTSPSYRALHSKGPSAVSSISRPSPATHSAANLRFAPYSLTPSLSGPQRQFSAATTGKLRKAIIMGSPFAHKRTTGRSLSNSGHSAETRESRNQIHSPLANWFSAPSLVHSPAEVRELGERRSRGPKSLASLAWGCLARGLPPIACLEGGHKFGSLIFPTSTQTANHGRNAALLTNAFKPTFPL
ncbi:hypothetical protein RHS01_11483 [Rhizoctonia solani]|uniref:Uncharacterized protein n=1 Tax=Rhizoctonia solani TaxID=456999 RepID=A0A8H7I2Y1_9AGAM|nr:hypothetical protein RHS01_11483 [Rhizoctonia solani]